MGFSGVSKAKAATYYVDGASGDDTTGTGAQVQPWKTLIKAETAAANGDTVNVQTGTYVEASTVGGSSGNITFTKAISWTGKGADWAGNGSVRLQGKTASTSITVAGNTNATSFANFIFDGQNGRSYNVSIAVGHANKTFTNCVFENNVSVGYLLMIYGGSEVTFNNCTFSYNNGGAGSDVFNTGAGIVINSSTISKTSGGVVTSSSSAGNVVFNNTTINIANPTEQIFSQPSTTNPLSIIGGSITVTGGSNTSIIRWTGNVLIDGLTANTSVVNGMFLESLGSSSTVLIEDANITHTMSGSTGNSFSNVGTSFSVKNSTIDIIGGYRAFVLTYSGNSLVMDNNTITYAPLAVSSFLLYSQGTGSASITNNDFDISSSTGNFSAVFYRVPSVRSITGDLDFSNNTVDINTLFDKIIYGAYCNDGDFLISNNVINSSSLEDSGFVIYTTDIPSPVIRNNIITTESTYAVDHISIMPSGDTNYPNMGIAEVSNNISYSKSHSGHVIALGQDGSQGVAYEQKYNGSIIENNTIYGPAYFGDNGQYNTHDILIGHSIKCYVRYNKIIGGGLGFVIKALGLDWENEGGVYGNVIINSTYGAILSKGARDLNIYNNTIYISSIYSPAYAVSIGEGIVDYPTTGNRLYNNIIYSKGANRLIAVDPYSVESFQAFNNVYWNQLGDLSQQLFYYNNIGRTGFNAWNTAIGGTDNSLSANPRFNNIGSNDATLQYPSSAIDAGASVSFATDYLGNHIYGTPDIGAYEYQPPYTITTDNPNISSPIRIYADGKYRYTNTTSGSTNAKLTITPQSGFGTGDYSQWMDVAIDTWHTSSDYYKKWTESSTNQSLVTNHTIGDLKPNTYYTLKIDTNNQDTYLSNGTGQITFPYSGGYSTHTFEITEDTISPAPFTLVSPVNNTVTSNRIPTFSWNASSDTESNLSKYQLYIDGVMDVNNIASSASSTFPSAELSCGNHSWYVKAIDNNNNTTNSNAFTLDINCAGGFIPSPKPIITPTDPTLGTVPSNITQIAISRTPDFTNISWQPFDKDKFKNIDQTSETLYVKFRTDQGAVSDTIIYEAKPSVIDSNPTTIPLIEGDIVKTPNNPDVYVIKYKNNKQYKRLILSPFVFKSYQHLKWENIKIVSQEQLDKYTTSNLIKETIDTIIYQLFPNGDIGERKAQDASINYDSDSVYEINATDRDSYVLVK